ncbi:predicted protein [Aspergillus nidulans FGSC A4]|uniref:Uncharacterized protein n=1 Tax=Emericella nidulans (strain FGSC A4 / ATCC 38163 / CBS 112.46 / NRRL 194 / M139) TaxID=227321 RepID=Q5AZ25_EMENI|nr:hypothetical protein [Aspergillus nidulans FGSC A4]EAA58477.1 predicted protein [Aspergillus nidulans FGSC A4]CBF69438.1 TPA: conserved hypothetical protein [Aspergillus nidulans FGSC A4]|eukprot:XP_664059.1 predicted protein [Aspergillus nidulans FGSC A4]
MIHSKVLFLAPVISSLAQDLPTDIVGCKDLDCPNEGWDSCTVADETYAGVGLARVSNAPDSLAGISLVKGVHIEDPKSGGNAGGDGSEESRSFRSVYYLGTPSNLEVADVSGCAVVFNDPPTGHFDVPKLNDSITVDTRASYGTCPDVIQQGCIEGLTRQAGKLQYSGSNACSALASDLRNNPPDECSDMTGSGDGLGSFDVVSLSNLSTISQSANGSSNCWPILPKTDNLAQLYDDTTKGNYTEQGNLAEMYKITPILTVFTSDNSTNSPVNNTAASLTCLKVVGTQDVTNATDPTDTDVDAAPLSAVNMVGASVAAIATLIFVLL